MVAIVLDDYVVYFSNLHNSDGKTQSAREIARNIAADSSLGRCLRVMKYENDDGIVLKKVRETFFGFRVWEWKHKSAQIFENEATSSQNLKHQQL
jgi:hypothetical protein